MANTNLLKAKESKNDEFYTQLQDIRTELLNYPDKFKDKVVFCNCDDPSESNFVKYFIMNFNRLGLKELIAAGYKISRVGDVEINTLNTPYVLRIKDTSKYLIGTQKDLDARGLKHIIETEGSKVMTPLIGNYALDENGNQIKISTKVECLDDDGNVILTKAGKPKMKTVEKDLYYEAGDFRSNMSIELLKESDIVVTNPPFSLFREFVALLMKYKKQFLIIGNMNTVICKEIFTLIKNNDIWFGYGRLSEFNTPKVNDTRVLVPCRWFTNLDYAERHKVPLDLGCTYYGHEDIYPKYDNYDAINVNKIAEIPSDYKGIMGVPITFLYKHCPEQFEIVGMANRGAGDPALKSKIYTKEEYSNYSDLNSSPTLFVNGVLKNIFPRILIKFKQDYINAHPEQFKDNK